MQSYKTLVKAGTGSYEEKRSRFIATASPVFSEEEALAILREVRSAGGDARHHCYAYALDDGTSVRRFSDDGEPSGTAGVPILEVMNKQGITNSIIVVSRWFGGVLLGASGLLRAYGHAASLAVENAGIMVVRECLEAVLSMEYTLSGKVAHLLSTGGYLTAGTDYAADVRIRLYLEPERLNRFEQEIADLTAARVDIQYAGTRSVAFTESGIFLRAMT